MGNEKFMVFGIKYEVRGTKYEVNFELFSLFVIRHSSSVISFPIRNSCHSTLKPSVRWQSVKCKKKYEVRGTKDEEKQGGHLKGGTVFS